MTMKEQSSQSAILQEKRKRTTLTYIVSVCFLFICIYLNLAIGSSHIEFKDIIHYITGHTDTKQTFLIHNSRMPRMLAGLLIGGALALAGLLMQSITRNPLASPQIFGVNAGASFVIVLITVLIPSLESYSMILAMIGAFLGGLTVYTLSGSTKAMTPVKLALAGMAIHLFFSSMTQGVILLNEDSNSSVMFWLVGSLSGVKWPEVIAITPWLVVAMIVTMLMGRQLTIMELGDDIAKGLGQKIQVVRMLLGLLVIILAGLSVSIAGPIGFVGLIVPHIVKRYIKNNYILMIPLTIIRYSIVTILLVISAIFSLCIGSVIVNPIEAIKGIFTHDNFILNEYRIPRTLLGLIIGSSLAISGAIIQGVVRNPLASPDVIGISKGASLAAVIIIMLFPSAPLAILPIGSFIGALMISLILSFLISKFDVKGSNLALIGLAIGAICTAIVQFLLIRNPMDANNALVWLTGSLYGHNISNFLSILPWFITYRKTNSWP